jgi:Zn-dependent metalloprotease
MLENFISANENLFGIRSLAQLEKTADYTNPDGNLSFVRYEQRIGGIPVFGAEIQAGFSKRNEMFRVINSLAPDVDSSKVATEFGSPENAVMSAASQIGIVPRDLKRSDSQKLEFTSDAFTDKVTAEKFYFQSATVCCVLRGEFCFGQMSRLITSSSMSTARCSGEKISRRIKRFRRRSMSTETSQVR